MTTPTQNVENTTIGRGIFHVQPPNVWNVPQPNEVAHAKKDAKFSQLNITVRKMHNKMSWWIRIE
jgi:hypothetical protein